MSNHMLAMGNDVSTTRDAAISAASWFEDWNTLSIEINNSIKQGEFEVATRGFIGRKTANGVSFEARYHHWDSYPSALGNTLYDLYRNHFDLDIDTMLHVLIDEHPAGWSNVVGANFTYAPGFSTPDYDLPDEDECNNRPQCYCHGERHEESCLISSLHEAGMMDCEYGYILDKTCLMEIHAITGEGWKRIATIDLNSPEPDWDTLEQEDEE